MAARRRTATARQAKSGETPGRDRAAQRRRAKRIVGTLHELYPDAECALHHENAYQLLVATILSAQCTDAKVNTVTPALFARYPDPAALARADPTALEKLIYSTGFYRNKAKNLKAMAEVVVERFGGEVPRSMEELLELPGVARKTANLVLGTAFGVAVGVVVDTHVARVSRKLGLTEQKAAVAIERDLIDLVPRDEWIFAAHALIWHGRQVCDAKRPRCGECALRRTCPSSEG